MGLSNPHFNPSILSVPVASAQELTTEDLKTIARNTAVSEGFSPRKVEELLGTIDCETKGTWNPKIQSEYIQKNGEREDSWGLAQIHLPDWPDISKQDAQNPFFAIHFIVSKFKMHQESKWSCWNLKYGGVKSP
jgi:hypothetical protein